MTRDELMLIAHAEAGNHWGTESHLYRFAMRIREQTLEEAAHIAESKFHSSYADCAEAIRAIGDSDE